MHLNQLGGHSNNQFLFPTLSKGVVKISKPNFTRKMGATISHMKYLILFGTFFLPYPAETLFHDNIPIGIYAPR